MRGRAGLFRHRDHVRLWDWLAGNPGKYKYDWPEWEAYAKLDDRPPLDCFACETGGCVTCPLDWLAANSSYTTCRLLYNTWRLSTRQLRDLDFPGVWAQADKSGMYIAHTHDVSELAQQVSTLAAQIRDLPIAPGWKAHEFYGYYVREVI